MYKSQIQSIMEYASLSWIDASASSLATLDNIQIKAIYIIRPLQESKFMQSLQHRQQVAAASVLHKMHSDHCPLPPHIPHVKPPEVLPQHPSLLSIPWARTHQLE